MTTDARSERVPAQLIEGEDFVCSNCGCEIVVKHPGNPERMNEVSAFVCACGTRMDREHQPARPMPPDMNR